MTTGQLRELPVVVRREVVADLTQLLVDDREVVDQPLGGRSDRALLFDRLSQHPVRLDEHTTVLGDSGTDDGDVEHVGLQLHQQIVGAGAAVDA